MMAIEWSRISLAIEWPYGSLRYHRLAIRFMDTHMNIWPWVGHREDTTNLWPSYGQFLGGHRMVAGRTATRMTRFLFAVVVWDIWSWCCVARVIVGHVKDHMLTDLHRWLHNHMNEIVLRLLCWSLLFSSLCILWEDNTPTPTVNIAKGYRRAYPIINHSI